MGGSTLGTQTIYSFLKHKVHKNFTFIDNLQSSHKNNVNKNYTNLIISKSGNTLEPISNSSLLINKNKNVFITEIK